MTDSKLIEDFNRIKAENIALRSAISLLHRIANLVRESTDQESTGYAVLTGVTAGIGLGMNRAMLFLCDELSGGMKGAGAVGPADHMEADRVWKSIEAEAPDLKTLYTAGLHQRDNPGRLDSIVRKLRLSTDGNNPVSLAFRRSEPVFSGGNDDLNGLLHLPTAIAAPMMSGDSLRGVLYADNSYTGRVPNPVIRQVFALVADHAGRALEDAGRFEKIAFKARTDALTGLPHHGAMWEMLDRQVKKSSGEGSALGVAMIDLDDFKKINDSYGHLAGDTLLAAVAGRLEGEMRDGSRLFRYGGEEFAVILPGGDPEKIFSLAGRLRRAVALKAFPLGEERFVSVTCSVGVASSQREIEGRRLIAAADEALFRAKDRGKNRVESAL